MRMHLWCSTTGATSISGCKCCVHNSKRMLCSGCLTCSESELPKARAAVLNVQGAVRNPTLSGEVPELLLPKVKQVTATPAALSSQRLRGAQQWKRPRYQREPVRVKSKCQTQAHR